jgi:hypothetical protein
MIIEQTVWSAENVKDNLWRRKYKNYGDAVKWAEVISELENYTNIDLESTDGYWYVTWTEPKPKKKPYEVIKQGEQLDDEIQISWKDFPSFAACVYSRRDECSFGYYAYLDQAEAVAKWLNSQARPY